jgi:DNA-binding response OmpR family regulator
VAKILCVDDEPALLRIYRDELSEEGYEVVVDGTERRLWRSFPR